MPFHFEIALFSITIANETGHILLVWSIDMTIKVYFCIIFVVLTPCRDSCSYRYLVTELHTEKWKYSSLRQGFITDKNEEPTKFGRSQFDQFGREKERENILYHPYLPSRTCYFGTTSLRAIHLDYSIVCFDLLCTFFAGCLSTSLTLMIEPTVLCSASVVATENWRWMLYSR